MRVLYDHQVFSLQNAGGASRYFYELAKYMTGVPDVRTEILMGMNGTAYPFTDLDSSKTHVVSFPAWLRPGTLRYIANEAASNLAAALLGRSDVYHPTTYLKMPMVRARRVVATHHDCTHERFPELFPDVNKVLWARKWLFPRVDAIICVSESCRQDLLQFYNVDASKTCVIHHGVTPLPRNAAAAAELRKQIKRDYILYVGMRPAFKNVRRLLQAVRDTRLHEDADLVIVGGGPLHEDEKKLIVELGLERAVTVIPKVADELLAEAYAAAKLFVYPSLNEGFGFPPLEAMSLGCPVLASRIPAVTEVCREAPFYFDPIDQQSFNRALIRALSDESARKVSVALGREIAASYCWSKCGANTLAVYRDC